MSRSTAEYQSESLLNGLPVSPSSKSCPSKPGVLSSHSPVCLLCCLPGWNIRTYRFGSGSTAVRWYRSHSGVKSDVCEGVAPWGKWRWTWRLSGRSPYAGGRFAWTLPLPTHSSPHRNVPSRVPTLGPPDGFGRVTQWDLFCQGKRRNQRKRHSTPVTSSIRDYRDGRSL